MKEFLIFLFKSNTKTVDLIIVSISIDNNNESYLSRFDKQILQEEYFLKVYCFKVI